MPAQVASETFAPGVEQQFVGIISSTVQRIPGSLNSVTIELAGANVRNRDRPKATRTTERPKVTHRIERDLSSRSRVLDRIKQAERRSSSAPAAVDRKPCRLPLLIVVRAENVWGGKHSLFFPQKEGTASMRNRFATLHPPSMRKSEGVFTTREERRNAKRRRDAERKASRQKSKTKERNREKVEHKRVRKGKGKGTGTGTRRMPAECQGHDTLRNRCSTTTNQLRMKRTCREVSAGSLLLQ